MIDRVIPLEDLRFARGGSSLVTPGPCVTCPLCSERLSQAVMGVNSHLRKHIRAGELAEADKLETRERMLGTRRSAY
jgi:hypothetical protein